MRNLEYAACVIRRRVYGFERGACASLQTLTPRLVPRFLRRYGAQIGDDVRIGSPLLVHNANRSFANLSVGDGVFIGRDCMLDLKDRIEIGDRATISMRVTIVTHMDVGRSSWRTRGYANTQAPVRIGADAYIGVGAVLLEGVEIGEGALVGACSLVRQSVPAGARVAGIPARPIGSVDPESPEPEQVTRAIPTSRGSTFVSP